MSRLWWVFWILFNYNQKLSYFEGHKRRRVRRGKDAGTQIKNIKKFSNTRLSCSARWLLDLFFHKITHNMIIVSGAILHQHYTGQWMEESSKTHPPQKLSQKSKSKFLYFLLSNIHNRTPFQFIQVSTEIYSEAETVCNKQIGEVSMPCLQ